jgi:hypothetical protein
MPGMDRPRNSARASHWECVSQAFEERARRVTPLFESCKAKQCRAVSTDKGERLCAASSIGRYTQRPQCTIGHLQRRRNCPPTQRCYQSSPMNRRVRDFVHSDACPMSASALVHTISHLCPLPSCRRNEKCNVITDVYAHMAPSGVSSATFSSARRRRAPGQGQNLSPLKQREPLVGNSCGYKVRDFVPGFRSSRFASARMKAKKTVPYGRYLRNWTTI